MATIYDIAKVSGVSATTVSHVLNHTRYVSPKITQRVMEAVERLGYQPKHRRNEAGNSASLPKCGSMGFFVDRQLLTTCGCRAYVRMARRYDWITISVEGPLTEKQLLRFVKQYRLSRVLIHQSVEFEYGIHSEHMTGPGSILLLNQQNSPQRTDFRHLTLDYESAVKTALEHLIRCGHTNISVVCGSLNQFCRQQILRALACCSQRYAVRLNQDNVIWLNKMDFSTELEQKDLGTGIISVGAPAAMAVIKFSSSAGKHAPQDFSWIAVDDDDFMPVYSPKTTLIRLDPSVFQSGIENDTVPERPIICRPEFVICSSTAMLPRDPNGQQAYRENAISLSITEKILLQKRSYRLGISFAQADTLYSQMILQGIREVAANLNVELLPVQNARLDNAVEENQLVWLLQNGADAIISISNDHTGMVDHFNRIARSSKVPLIIGSHLPASLLPSTYYSCITTNDEEKGRQVAQFLAEQMLPRGMQRLVLLLDKSTDADAQQCARALLTALSGDYQRIQVLEQAVVKSSNAMEEFEKIYRRCPEMQGLYVQNARAAGEISRLLCTKGRDDIVIVTSQINSLIAQQILQSTSGRIGIISSRPIELGHLMAYAAASALMGKPAPKYVSVDPITLNQKNVEELWPMLTQSRLT